MIKTKFYFTRSPLDFDYDVFITDTPARGKQGVARPVVFEAKEPGAHSDPAMRMTQEELQGLFDALWHEGFRPARLEDSAAALGAVKDHLEDMRRLVFDSGPTIITGGTPVTVCTCGTSSKCVLHE